MKNFKSLLPFLLMLFVWAGCDTDDLRNDVDELKNRVAVSYTHLTLPTILLV